MKSFSVLVFILGFLFFFSLNVQAIENPLAVPNNPFGIHIIDENDFEKAAELVNSSGGDWGYVTLVIREDDRDQAKWQRIFDELRRHHLIPLVRLATAGEGSSWRAPKPEDAAAWANFLDSLNWVIKNRYLILFNEPNHAKEWGGTIKPAEFAAVVKAFHQALKAKSEDFFILPGAVDSASTDSKETMSARQFYQWMLSADPSVFSYYDGLVSHSYPHPDFIGSVTDRGPGTITAYRWEQNYLKTLGLSPNLPVFITETGWAHNGGRKPILPALKPEKIAHNYETAFNSIWTDTNLVAITPFILNYQDAPFDQFSFIKPGGNETQPQFETIKTLSKITGQPRQVMNASIDTSQIPAKLVQNSHYRLSIYLTNMGQNIWQGDVDRLVITSPLVSNGRLEFNLPDTEPLEDTQIAVNLNTPEKIGAFPFKVTYEHNGQETIGSINQSVNVINPPSIYLKARLWFKRQSSGNDFTLLIYQNGDLLKKISPFTLKNGSGAITRITDVVPNRQYRFVIVKSYYLPRQTFAVLNDSITEITFKRLLPLDIYPDGQLTLQDLLATLNHPLLFLSLWWW